MASTRSAVGYVVKVDGPNISLNLNEAHRGQASAHASGISYLGQPDDLLAINAGTELIVARVSSIAYAEPKEAHRVGLGEGDKTNEPLRQIHCRAVGFLRKEGAKLEFIPEEWRLPPLGAEAYPLTSDEQQCTVATDTLGAPRIDLGVDARTGLVHVAIDLNALLTRHVAVLGSTGQGKTHFVAAIVQQLYRGQDAPRIVIFDINGEYSTAFDNGEDGRVRLTKVGGGRGEQPNQRRIRIPYYALGRRGLFRLLLPSDRTQAPSLRFAIEHLPFVEADEQGARLAGQDENVLFDDARQLGAQQAFEAMNAIRTQRAPRANRWPHMRALSCLAAEWYALAPDNRGQPSRNAFNYGHVQSLINRIRGLIEDERFRDVVDVEGGRPLRQDVLDLPAETSALVAEIFGGSADGEDWNVHVVDLSQLTQDLMPFVLGSLLELFAAELFRRGPGQTHPTLLVLEEAHHYMHQESSDAEGLAGGLAYERLAKEGRKFGLALLVSTQRPSELSSTVLSQCGTWCVFRLTNEQDQKAVFTAAETGANYILRQMSGLGRGQAIIFGSALPMATLTQVIRADPEPRSSDADFVRRWGGR